MQDSFLEGHTGFFLRSHTGFFLRGHTGFFLRESHRFLSQGVMPVPFSGVTQVSC